jgi:hypothetical protein
MSDLMISIIRFGVIVTGGLVLLFLSVLAWGGLFAAIDKHMERQEITYQECGGRYCPMMEESK